MESGQSWWRIIFGKIYFGQENINTLSGWKKRLDCNLKKLN